MPAKVLAPPNGVEFPLDSTGQRSTTEINREAFAVAVEAIDPELAQKVRGEKKWRFKYAQHLVAQVEASLRTPDAAIKVAEAGLQFLHSKMEFIRDDKAMPLTAAMDTFKTGSFETGVVEGKERSPTLEAEVPYKGQMLRGDALRVQVDKWVRSGVIELSCGQALCHVMDTHKWRDLSDTVVVMLGASSAMGPFPLLMSLGATVVAVDIDRPALWRKLIATCRASSGRLVLPLKKPQSACKTDEELAEAAGCNLLTQTPEIRNWLRTVEPGRPLAVGAYAYLDGPLFLKISLAMDCIVADLVEHRHAAVAYLCTPTDAHVVPAAAPAHSAANLRSAPLWQRLLALVRGSKAMGPNRRKPVTAEDGAVYHVCDAIVPDQGPNYILAKRLQHWRAMLARTRGRRASSNIAPSTATASVVSNKAFALAYQGMHHFRPVEVFEQETSAAIMGLLLIYDLRSPLSAATASTHLPHPLMLFTETACHGGAWRCAYKFGSIGVGSVAAALFTNFVVRSYLALYNLAQALGWGAALAALGHHAFEGRPTPLWQQVGPYIATFQWLAVLEVAHSLLGMVRSPVGTTAVQVFSRVLLVSAVQHVAKLQSNDNVWLWLMCAAWGITEVVRYTYYGLGQVGTEVRLLTWLRYTLFLALYPLGVAGEMGCLYEAQEGLKALPGPEAPFLARHVLHPILRHPWGYLLAVVPVYAVGLTTLYSHMLAQRRRLFNTPAKKQD